MFCFSLLLCAGDYQVWKHDIVHSSQPCLFSARQPSSRQALSYPPYRFYDPCCL